MFVLDISHYALLEGLLALALAYFLYRRNLAVAAKGRTFRKMIGGAWLPAHIFSRFFFSTAVLSVLCLFVVLLILLETKISALAFLAGAVSSAGLILLTNRTGALADLADTSVHQKGLITGLALSGAGLAGVGLFFYILTWEDTQVISGYALGAAFVLLFASRNEGSRNGPPGRAVADILDIYVSYLSVLIAALAVGQNLEYHERIWTGMSVLFVMTGLAVSVPAGLSLSMISGPKRGKASRYAKYLAGLVFMATAYYVDCKLTGKMTSDTVAYSGMVDRLGPFWSLVTGFATGVVLKAVHGYDGWMEKKDAVFASAAIPAYFMAMGLWIAYLLAGPYGVAVAGIGFLGTLFMDSCFSVAGKSDVDGARKFNFDSSVFAACALLAAYSAVVTNVAGEEDLLIDFAGVAAVAGLLLGGLMSRLMPVLEKRFNLARHMPLYVVLVVLIPCSVGVLIGPESLGGFVLGVILIGTFTGLINRSDNEKTAAGMSALMRLIALVALVFAPAIIKLYESLH